MSNKQDIPAVQSASIVDEKALAVNKADLDLSIIQHAKNNAVAKFFVADDLPIFEDGSNTIGCSIGGTGIGRFHEGLPLSLFFYSR